MTTCRAASSTSPRYQAVDVDVLNKASVDVSNQKCRTGAFAEQGIQTEQDGTSVLTSYLMLVAKGLAKTS